MQIHYAEVLPESVATLPRWVEAGFIAINRVSLIRPYYLHDDSENDLTVCKAWVRPISGEK